MIASRVKTFVENAGNLSKLNQALSFLYEINFDSIMRQVGLESYAPPPTVSVAQITLESNALRSAWLDGYQKAIDDMFTFPDRFREVPTQQTAPKPFTQRPNFGASKTLVDSGQISQEEAFKLYGSDG